MHETTESKSSSSEGMAVTEGIVLFFKWRYVHPRIAIFLIIGRGEGLPRADKKKKKKSSTMCPTARGRNKEPQ